MEDVFEIAYNSAAELNKAIKSNVEFGIVDLQYCCFGLINNKYFGEELKCQEEWEQRLLLAKIKNRLLYNGNIYLLPFYERVDKYLYNLYKEYKDNQKIKEVTQHLLELIRPYYNNLHQPPDKLAEIRIAKYKYIIDTYDYFLEIERENKELSYSYHSDIIEWDIEYYLSLLEQIVTDVLCYVEYEICDKYDLCFEEIITQSNMNIFLSKTDDNRKKDAEQTPQLPQKLNTPEAMKYFNLAVKKGYMKICDNKYCWIDTGRGTIAKLAYFLSFVYLPTRPYNDLEEYFGVKKLSSAVAQAEYKPKRNDVKTWRNKMKTDLNLNNTLNDRQNG